MTGEQTLTYDREALPTYVTEVLAAGVATVFLPAGFVREAAHCTGVWQTEGYRRLAAVRELSTEAALGILLSLLHGLWQAERVYLTADRFLVEPEVLFTDRSLEDVRMIYVPDPEQQPLPRKLEQLLQALRERGHREGYPYLDRACALVREEGWGYRSMTRRLEALRREVYLCSIA